MRRTPRSGTRAVSALAVAVAGLLLGPMAAASARTAAPLTSISGKITSVDAAHRALKLTAAGHVTTVVLTSGGQVQSHGLPTTLAALRTGMTAFVEGQAKSAATFSAQRVWALRVSTTTTTVTGRLATVDPAGAMLVLETGPELRDLLMVPATAALRFNGKAVTMSQLKAGQVASVRGYADNQDPAELVAKSVDLQPATFTPDVQGTLTAVDVTQRFVTIQPAIGSAVSVAVPLSTPILASGVPWQLDYLQLGATTQVLLDSSGSNVARLVAADQ